MSSPLCHFLIMEYSLSYNNSSGWGQLNLTTLLPLGTTKDLLFKC